MSVQELTEQWRRSLTQADEFARSGATDEAVARALWVYRATTDALVRANPHDRAIILGYVHRSRDELDRLRVLDSEERERTAARSRSHSDSQREASTSERSAPRPDSKSDSGR